MGDYVKKINDAIDAFEKCLDAEIEITKEYKQKADAINEQAKKVYDDAEDDAEKELTKFESELEKDYYSYGNKKITNVLRAYGESYYLDHTIGMNDVPTSSDILRLFCNDEISHILLYVKVQLDSRSDNCHIADTLDAFTLSWFGGAALSNSDVKRYVSEMDQLKVEKDKLEQENKDLDAKMTAKTSKEEKKYLIAAIISFAIGVIFVVIGAIVNNFLTIGSWICGFGIVAGIIFLVLRSRVCTNSKIAAYYHKINENKINIGNMRSKIIDSKLSVIVKAIIEKEGARDKQRNSMLAESQTKLDLLDSKLKEIGDETEKVLEQKREEILSGFDPIILNVFGKAFEFPMNYRKDFVFNCRARNIDSAGAMLDIIDSLQNKLDEENARSERAMREQRMSNDVKKALYEQNTILKKQAEDAKRAQDEQNRLLRRQADEQRSMQEKQISEQKRIGEEFRRTMCYQCKNHVGCSFMWHLTGPCPNYVKGK